MNWDFYSYTDFVVIGYTPWKSNMDTKNKALEKVIPFKYDHLWYTPEV